jgi:outer membrane protein, heavy metal efflux system
MKTGSRVPVALVLATGLGLWAREADAQAPGTTPGVSAESRGERSSLGPAPGSGEHPFGTGPGGDEGTLGGRPGTSTPRVPSSITRPGQEAFGLPSRPAIGPPPSVPVAEVPMYGPLAIPGEEADEGPPEGLTLDMAIDRLVRENLDLRSRFIEIPQAQADILTAGLRANPILYADAQLIPYGGYSKERPGGPTQYDLNVTFPLDVTRKRRARIEVACQAKRVLEAQYQDAVRLQIDNLYTAFVDVLAARQTVRYARASLAGLDQVLGVARAQLEREVKTQADVNRIKILRDAAAIGVAESEQSLREARRALAVLLSVPPAAADGLEVRGAMRVAVPTLPPAEQLVQTALAVRPDLVAYRLGVGRAQSEVKLAHANRLSDVYLLAQPYTFQDNSPFGQKSSHSWALGVTIPLPIYNRNQGNIERARLNVGQTQTELASLEQQVIAEVRKASEQYAVSRSSVESIERDLLPAAEQVLETASRLYKSGEADVVVYLNAQRDYNEVVRQYRDTLIRHRRSTLRLNTAVGQRVLP